MPKVTLAVSLSDTALRDAFGPPHHVTDKIREWRIRQGLGVVLQLDSPKGESCAYLWMPELKDAKLPPVEYMKYSKDKGRHSNTHPCPGLEEGKPAILFKIRSRAEIVKIVEILNRPLV